MTDPLDTYTLDLPYGVCGMRFGELDEDAIEEMAQWSFSGGDERTQIGLADGMPHWALIQAIDEENPA